MTDSPEHAPVADEYESVAHLDFEPVQIKFDLSNEEFCLRYLTHIRLAVHLHRLSKSELAKCFAADPHDEEALDSTTTTVEMLVETKDHLTEFAKMCEVAACRLIVVLEGEMDSQPTNDKPQQATCE